MLRTKHYGCDIAISRRVSFELSKRSRVKERERKKDLLDEIFVASISFSHPTSLALIFIYTISFVVTFIDIETRSEDCFVFFFATPSRLAPCYNNPVRTATAGCRGDAPFDVSYRYTFEQACTVKVRACLSRYRYEAMRRVRPRAVAKRNAESNTTRCTVIISPLSMDSTRGVERLSFGKNFAIRSLPEYFFFYRARDILSESEKIRRFARFREGSMREH